MMIRLAAQEILTINVLFKLKKNIQHLLKCKVPYGIHVVEPDKNFKNNKK